MGTAAVFDACVLYKPAIRDLLMEFAVAGLCRGHWTDQIHDEWIGNLLEKRPGLDPENLARTRRKMDEAVPGGLVTGHEHLIEELHLPDPGDRHVLAAAIHAEATVIVTTNLRDFPAGHIPLTHAITAIHPDDFLLSLITQHPVEACAAIRRLRERLKSPPYSPEKYVENLRKKELPKTAGELEKRKSEI